MSGGIWAVAETAGGSLAPSSAGVASLATELAGMAGRDASAVVVGDADEASAIVAAFVPRVVHAHLAGGPDPVEGADAAAVIARLAADEGVAYILVPATPWGRSVAGSLAARLGWGILTGAERISWAGSPVVETVVFRTETRVESGFTSQHGVVTVRPNVTPTIALAVPGAVEHVRIPAGAPRTPVRRLRHEPAPPQPLVPTRDTLERARVVVAGGAGVGDPGAWTLVEQLAEALGAAVGASRPAVDQGWASPSRQIGQSGRTIRPDVYVALGISGEILHRMGMRASRAVVAVTLDADAPFRAHADLLALADLHALVPALLHEIDARRHDADCEPGAPP